MNDPLVQNQGAVEKQANVGTNNGTIIVGSDNSQNSQAGQIHIHQGMNYDEVRTLCLDLVQSLHSINSRPLTSQCVVLIG